MSIEVALSKGWSLLGVGLNIPLHFKSKWRINIFYLYLQIDEQSNVQREPYWCGRQIQQYRKQNVSTLQKFHNIRLLLPSMGGGMLDSCRANLIILFEYQYIHCVPVDEYIQVSKEKYGYNAEQALGMLFWHKHDLDKAIQVICAY